MNTRLAVAFVGLVSSSAALAQPQCPGRAPTCPAGSHAQCVPTSIRNPDGPGRWQCEPNPLPPPLTDLNQAWTQINNVAYEFVVDTTSGHATSGHVMMLFFQVGSTSSNWIDLGAPPSGSGPGAITGPAATSVPGSGFIFLTVANHDHKVCLNQGHDQSWTGWNC